MPKASVDFTSIIYTFIIKIHFNLNKNKSHRLLNVAHSFTFSRGKKNPANSITVIETEKATHYRKMFQWE